MKLIAALLTCATLCATPVMATDYSDLPDQIEGYRELKKMPALPTVEMLDHKGTLTTMEKYKGKTVLLNFWATWCPPCIREMPALNNLAKTFEGQNFAVVAVASGRQGREEPDAFLQKRNLTAIKSYRDPKQAIMQQLGVRSLPVTLLIDPEGQIRGGVIGMTEWDTDDAIEGIQQILK